MQMYIYQKTDTKMFIAILIILSKNRKTTQMSFNKGKNNKNNCGTST